MGLPGLVKYCLENQAQCVEFVDLVDIARKNGGISLVVDMWTFGFCLPDWFSKYIEAKTHNQYLKIIDVELSSLDQYVTVFLNKLAAVGISLVWVIDAEKAESLKLLKTRISRLENKHSQLMENIGMLVEVCKGKRKMENFPFETLYFQILSQLQLECAVRRHGCEVIQCSHDDGDLLMMKRLLNDDKTYSIMSEDADFLIFENSSCIPKCLFDINNNLHLEDGLMTTDHVGEPITQLLVGRLSTANVSKHFKFSRQKMMADLSILRGNGYTWHFIYKHYMFTSSMLNLKSKKTCIPELARYVSQFDGSIEDIPAVTKLLALEPEFRAAINDSRRFYDSSRELPSDPEPGTYRYFITKRVENHSLPPDVISIINGFYWRILVIEEHLMDWPCVEAALSPLRRYIYRMLIPSDITEVKEFGRGCNQNFDVATVDISDVKIVNLEDVKEENHAENLEIFHWIMSHMERDDAEKVYELRNPQHQMDPGILTSEDERDTSIKNYFAERDEQTAFVMYLLRYMLVLNWRQNLSIDRHTFLALAAVVLRKPDESRYQTLNRRPRMDTVTIFSWLMDIYRHAYSYLARSLYLTPSFPEPKDLFCGSAWIAFHACCNPDIAPKLRLMACYLSYSHRLHQDYLILSSWRDCTEYLYTIFNIHWKMGAFYQELLFNVIGIRTRSTRVAATSAALRKGANIVDIINKSDNDAEDLEEAREEIRRVLSENADIVKCVTLGYINFDPKNPFLEEV